MYEEEMQTIKVRRHSKKYKHAQDMCTLIYAFYQSENTLNDLLSNAPPCQYVKYKGTLDKQRTLGTFLLTRQHVERSL